MDIPRRNSKCPGIPDSFVAGLTKGILMDINRNKRKGGRAEESVEFSQQSILSAMDRFVHAVNNMDETIMVPSRLLDMALHNPDAEKTTNANTNVIPRSMTNNDMFSFYTMLNAVKNELIWGSGDNAVVMEKDNNNPTTGKPVRRLSQVSFHSYSDSDVESESSSEFDSGVEFDEQSTQIAASFRQHMTGLFQVLHQLTDAANFLTTRYQDEVGGAS